MNEELKTIIRTNDEKYRKIILIGIGFICVYFLFIFIREFLAFLRFTPPINIFEGAYEVLNPILFYMVFALSIIGLILIIISLSKYKNNYVKNFRKKISNTRNLFIVALIIRPLTFLYYVLIAFSAWGDDYFAQYLWTGGDLINHIFILLPMFFLAISLEKERKISNEQSVRLLFPQIIISFLGIWILGYLISLFLNFNVFNDQYAMGMTIMINSLAQLIFNSLGIIMFIELGLKSDKLFWQKEEELKE